MTEDYVGYVLTQLDKISNSFNVDFVISISIDTEKYSRRIQRQDRYFFIKSNYSFSDIGCLARIEDSAAMSSVKCVKSRFMAE